LLSYARAYEVDFYITYEFKSFALGLLMGKMFDRAFRKFTDAFESRVIGHHLRSGHR
jgi:ribosome-associated toxin RatA of RatAB toxin-antitoxin module